MHVHATVAGVEILVVGVEMHARARATGKATPAAIYSYSRNALPVLVGHGSGLEIDCKNLRCGRPRSRGAPPNPAGRPNPETAASSRKIRRDQYRRQARSSYQTWRPTRPCAQAR